MNLILPTPGQEPGSTYGDDQNQSFTIIDGHTHGPGSGVPITPTGININANLPFNGFNITGLYGIQFGSPAASSNLAFLYTNSQTGGGITDLFYNDGAGNVIAITKAGDVNATIASIPGESYSGGTFTWVQGNGSTTPANFDIGSITIRPNTAGTTNGVVLGPPSAISSQYNIQLPIVPGSTSFVSLDSSGNMGSTVTTAMADIVGTTMSSTGANAVANSRTRTVGNPVAAGGFALSSSSGSFSSSSGSDVKITNMGVTITTTGRPVQIGFMDDGSATAAVVVTAAGAVTDTTFTIWKGLVSIGTVISNTTLSLEVVGSTTIEMFMAPGALNLVDTSVSGIPGTYTYEASVRANAGSFGGSNIKMFAYEL